jgi:hypothetical protein
MAVGRKLRKIRQIHSLNYLTPRSLYCDGEGWVFTNLRTI